MVGIPSEPIRPRRSIGLKRKALVFLGQFGLDLGHGCARFDHDRQCARFIQLDAAQARGAQQQAVTCASHGCRRLER